MTTPEFIDVERRIEALTEHVARVVDDFPPLTEPQRARIAALLHRVVSVPNKSTPVRRSKEVEVTEASGDALTEDLLTKVSVLMTEGSMNAITRASEATGDSRTDTLNRAMHVYAAIITAEPGTVIKFDMAAPGGRRRRVSIIL